MLKADRDFHVPAVEDDGGKNGEERERLQSRRGKREDMDHQHISENSYNNAPLREH